jgi:hypothetical protein
MSLYERITETGTLSEPNGISNLSIAHIFARLALEESRVIRCVAPIRGERGADGLPGLGGDEGGISVLLQ